MTGYVFKLQVEVNFNLTLLSQKCQCRFYFSGMTLNVLYWRHSGNLKFLNERYTSWSVVGLPGRMLPNVRLIPGGKLELTQLLRTQRSFNIHILACLRLERKSSRVSHQAVWMSQELAYRTINRVRGTSFPVNRTSGLAGSTQEVSRGIVFLYFVHWGLKQCQMAVRFLHSLAVRWFKK